jgi:hypothetical protein
MHSSPVSAGTDKASPPAALMACSTGCSVSSRRDTRATLKSSSANFLATLAPVPGPRASQNHLF